MSSDANIYPRKDNRYVKIFATVTEQHSWTYIAAQHNACSIYLFKSYASIVTAHILNT